MNCRPCGDWLLNHSIRYASRKPLVVTKLKRKRMSTAAPEIKAITGPPPPEPRTKVFTLGMSGKGFMLEKGQEQK